DEKRYGGGNTRRPRSPRGVPLGGVVPRGKHRTSNQKSHEGGGEHSRKRERAGEGGAELPFLRKLSYGVLVVHLRLKLLVATSPMSHAPANHFAFRRPAEGPPSRITGVIDLRKWNLTSDEGGRRDTPEIRANPQVTTVIRSRESDFGPRLGTALV